MPCPPPGDLPDPGTEPESPVSPALQVNSLPLERQLRHGESGIRLCKMAQVEGAGWSQPGLLDCRRGSRLVLERGECVYCQARISSSAHSHLVMPTEGTRQAWSLTERGWGPRGNFAGEISPSALESRLQKVLWTRWRQDAEGLGVGSN